MCVEAEPARRAQGTSARLAERRATAGIGRSAGEAASASPLMARTQIYAAALFLLKGDRL